MLLKIQCLDDPAGQGATLQDLVLCLVVTCVLVAGSGLSKRYHPGWVSFDEQARSTLIQWARARRQNGTGHSANQKRGDGQPGMFAYLAPVVMQIGFALTRGLVGSMVILLKREAGRR